MVEVSNDLIYELLNQILEAQGASLAQIHDDLVEIRATVDELVRKNRESRRNVSEAK